MMTKMIREYMDLLQGKSNFTTIKKVFLPFVKKDGCPLGQ